MPNRRSSRKKKTKKHYKPSMKKSKKRTGTYGICTYGGKWGKCNKKPRQPKSQSCKTGEFDPSTRKVKYTTRRKPVYSRKRLSRPRGRDGKCTYNTKQKDPPSCKLVKGGRRLTSGKCPCASDSYRRKGRCRVTQQTRRERCEQSGKQYVSGRCVKRCKSGEKRSRATNRCRKTTKRK